MRAADIDETARETTTSSMNSASAGRRHSQPTTITHTGNTNNSNTAHETSANSTGLLASLWTKMSEYVELRTLESHPSVSSTDSGRFSAGSDLFDSGESINGLLADKQAVQSAERPVQHRNGHQQHKEHGHTHRNSIWNYFFGGGGGGGGSSTDSKQSSSATKSKPPSRKNSSTSSLEASGHRPRSASYSSPSLSASANHTKVKESIPTAAETEFAANGTNTWLEWNPLDDEDDSDSSDSSSLVAEDELLHQGTGEGHNFVPVFSNFTWCDQCGGVIWGFRQCLRCSYCKYTCHYKCLNEVKLDCDESPVFKEAPSESPQHTIVAIQDGVEDTSSLTGLSRVELMWRIEEFNRKVESYPIKLESDSLIFVGSLRIYMNLSRPISIPSGSPLPKACSTLRPYDHSVDHSKRRTSFFLPKNTYEDIQIASESTAIQVIQGVLSHIQVIDNCRKFALFERSEENGEVLMRKLADEDKPLLLRLLWGGDNATKRYELRENETGQIEWEAFTVPELQNFLRILDKEEQDHIEQVQNKYLVYEKRLKDAMAYID